MQSANSQHSGPEAGVKGRSSTPPVRPGRSRATQATQPALVFHPTPQGIHEPPHIMPCYLCPPYFYG
eukprot:6656655-Ditylum_brightwellii.AAC.1